MIRPFIEKYRPSEYKNVVGIPPQLLTILENETPGQHILLTSTPGTGKTCISKILIKKHPHNALVLNASDERGIDVVRTKIKNFVNNQSLNNDVKIVNLEEFDYMTPDAQNSLRNTMEECKNTIFIMTANYENKIVDAIKNRCHHFKMISPDKDKLRSHLSKIAHEENIEISPEAIIKLIDLNYPSIRNMVKKLQELGMLNKSVVEQDVAKDSDNIAELVDLIKAKKYNAAQSWVVDSLMDYEYVIGKIYDILIKDAEISKDKKLNIVQATRKALSSINYVARKEIEFGGYLADLFEVF